MPPNTKQVSRKPQIILEKFQCFVIAAVITPAYLWVQVTVVLPKLLKLSYINPYTYLIHVFLGIYFWINIAGNMLLSIFTDPRLKEYHGPGMYCEQCKQNRPEDTWHCPICNACILRRDHHCCFLSHCVGRKNLRYFICMLSHLTLAIPYFMCCKFLVIVSEFDMTSFVETTFVIINPNYIHNLSGAPDLGRIVVVLFWYIDLFLVPFSIVFVCCHMRNALRGLTAFECLKRKAPSGAHWTSNMQYAFGTRWRLVIFWPFLDSPLADT